MTVTLTKVRIYSCLTLLVGLFSLVLTFAVSFWFAVLFIVVFAQYEYVQYHISYILRQYVLLHKKLITEVRFSKVQLLVLNLLLT